MKANKQVVTVLASWVMLQILLSDLDEKSFRFHKNLKDYIYVYNIYI